MDPETRLSGACQSQVSLVHQAGGVHSCCVSVDDRSARLVSVEGGVGKWFAFGRSGVMVSSICCCVTPGIGPAVGGDGFTVTDACSVLSSHPV